MTKQFTPEQEAEIVVRYRTGVSSRAIGREFGCSDKPIMRVLREHEAGIRRGGIQSRYTDEQKQAMADRYVAGDSLQAVALEYGCQPSHVLQILRGLEVQTRSKGRARRVTQETLDLIKQRRREGVSAKYIATELGVETIRVTRWLAMLGLPTKTKGRGPDSSGWKGGRIRHSSGYWQIWVARDDPLHVMAWHNDYVLEHRLVMARALGRPLEPHETVHHVSGDADDNRLENLQLRQGKHGKGVVMSCLDCGSHNVGPMPIT